MKPSRKDTHKLDQMDDGKGPEATWNMGRLPKDLGKGRQSVEGPVRNEIERNRHWQGPNLETAETVAESHVEVVEQVRTKPVAIAANRSRTGFSTGCLGPDRLFFAAEGCWRGYFNLAGDILYNPEDDKKPYSLLFDVASWTEIEPVPVKRFRSFRYLDGIPKTAPETPGLGSP